MVDKVILQNIEQQYSYTANFPATRARDQVLNFVCLEFFSIAAKERRYNILHDLHITFVERMRYFLMYIKTIASANFSYQLKSFKFTYTLDQKCSQELRYLKSYCKDLNGMVFHVKEIKCFYLHICDLNTSLIFFFMFSNYCILATKLPYIT